MWKFNYSHEPAEVIRIHNVSLAAGEAKEDSMKSCGKETFT